MLIVFTLFVPTNSGLQYARRKGLDYVKRQFSAWDIDVQEARGENIPRLLNNLFDDDYPVVGITGEDLLDNYVQAEVEGQPWNKRIRRRQLTLDRLNLQGTGEYEQTMYGLPTLCLLGEAEEDVEDGLPDFIGKRIAVPRVYEALLRSRVNLQGAEVLSLDGKVDVTLARGGADYAIDIVLSGRTCEQEGLKILTPLYSSDGVVLVNQEAKLPEPRRSPYLRVDAPPL